MHLPRVDHLSNDGYCMTRQHHYGPRELSRPRDEKWVEHLCNDGYYSVLYDSSSSLRHSRPTKQTSWENFTYAKFANKIYSTDDSSLS